MKKLENPFPEYGYFGAAYFCDREQETETLMKNALHLTNPSQISRRR